MVWRILHLHNYSNWGGNLEHVRLAIQGLDRSRFRPYLAAPAREAYLDRFRSMGVAILPFEARARHDLAAVVRLAALVRRHRIDLIHSHLRRTDWVAAWARILCPGRIWVTTVHGEINRGDDYRRLGDVRNRVYGRVLRHGFHRVLSVSRALSHQLTVEEKLPRRRVHTLWNGIDTADFSLPAHAERRRLRRQMGIGPDDPVTVLVGRFGARKGHAVLLEAVARLVRPDAPWWVLLPGDGDGLEDCRALARRLGLAGWVRFPGFQKRVRACLAAADFIVVPSFSEGLPRSLLEGMAMGLCPVASDIGGIREALAAPVYGVTFAPGDVRALAGLLGQLWRDAPRRRRLGRRAAQRVRRFYRAQRLVEDHQRIYTDLLSRCRR